VSFEVESKLDIEYRSPSTVRFTTIYLGRGFLFYDVENGVKIPNITG